jgi:hypothetical protein
VKEKAAATLPAALGGTGAGASETTTKTASTASTTKTAAKGERMPTAMAFTGGPMPTAAAFPATASESASTGMMAPAPITQTALPLPLASSSSGFQRAGETSFETGGYKAATSPHVPFGLGAMPGAPIKPACNATTTTTSTTTNAPGSSIPVTHVQSTMDSLSRLDAQRRAQQGSGMM